MQYAIRKCCVYAFGGSRLILISFGMDALLLYLKFVSDVCKMWISAGDVSAPVGVTRTL